MPGPGMELVDEQEIEEVISLLRSGYLFRHSTTIEGKKDTRFQGKVYEVERTFADRLGVEHALAVNSGTSGLFVSLAALGVGPGDEVIVPGYGFVGTYSSIVLAWAVPVLAEVDETLTLDPRDLRAKITSRTKAIVVVNVLGAQARLRELRSLADEYGLRMVEDCCQSAGASYRGSPVGTVGHIGVFSFNAFKPITSCEGGMIVTDDAELYTRCFALHDQGLSPSGDSVMIGERPIIGFNFKFTEIQAALLGVQIRKLDPMLEHLRSNKRRYEEKIADLPGVSRLAVTDPEGECGTVLGVLLPNGQVARRIAGELGTCVVADTGWHVYSNITHLLDQATATPDRTPFNSPLYTRRGGAVTYRKGMLPVTDDLVSRALLIGIGVKDPALGTGFGLSVHAGPEEVDRSAARFREVVLRHLG